MSILQSLVNFYMANSLNRVLMVLIFWLIWPGSVFLVGLVFESRIVPIGKRQLKAFFPGSLAFGVMFVALISMYADFDPVLLVRSWLYWLILAILMFFLANEIRNDDIMYFPLRSQISPTKITHDIVGYFMAPTIIMGLIFPQLFAIWLTTMPEVNWPSWLIFAGSGIFYVICLKVDVETDYTIDDIQVWYPEDWAPIWVTHRIKK